MGERIEDAASGAADQTPGDQPEPGGNKLVKADSAPARPPAGRPGTVSIQVSTVIRTAVIGALVLAVIVLAGFLWAARNEISDTRAQTRDDQQAEQVALDYGVGAATVDYRNVNVWLGNLKSHTIAQLANKFDATGQKLEQILVELKWTSTATPITAKVVSHQGDIYKVNVFVNVTSTNAQTPQGAQSTVTYNVTLDKNADWQITDVGGLEGALPLK